MGISLETIRTYIRRVYEKPHVHLRIEAVLKDKDSREGVARLPKGTSIWNQ